MIKVSKASDEQKEAAQAWPVWEKEVSEFPWEYAQKEEFYVIEGKASVTPDSGEAVSFEAGDYVVMAQGLKCTWKVIEPIKKQYRFG